MNREWRVKMKKYLQRFTVLLLSVYSLNAYSAFMVTQTSFGVDLAKPVTKETTLINQSDKPVRVRVDFEKQQWAKEQYYLGDQLVAYPKIVVIPPKGKVQVKIAPRIKKTLPDGEYVALLVFKELPPRNSTDQVTMLMNIGVPYYGRKGKLKVAMDFDNLHMAKIDNGYELQGAAYNSGNFSYSLNIAVKLYQNKNLLKEEDLKQGFFRESPTDLKKPIIFNGNADYAEVFFFNENLNFSKKFSFVL
jgi:P pilus assembly chaperone PapD